MNRLALIAVTSVMLGACEESFEPVGEYTDRAVVYSVLDPFTDTQYVRLYSTYNAAGHNPANQTVDTGIRDAVVRVSGVSSSFTFSDTLLPRPAGSRYADSVLIYYAPGFQPQKGQEYLLEVISPFGTALSVARVPSASVIYTNETGPLVIPQNYAATQSIVLRGVLSEYTHAYFFRLMLDYEIAVPGGWEPHEVEIPLTLFRQDTITQVTGVYPQMRERGTDPLSNRIELRTDVETFNVAVYRRVIQLLRNVYPPGFIRFIRARLVLFQTGKDFYTYTKLANGFTDENSVRTDEPDFSNISGGRGLFGAVSRDTLSYAVPQTLGL